MTVTSLIYLTPGSQNWQRYILPEPQPGLTLSIGRGVENALILDDIGVSTNHAMLLIDPQGIYILDQNSSNGTAVNGQWINPNEWIAVTTGCPFVLGGTTFYLEADQPSEVAFPSQQISPPTNFSNVQQNNYIDGSEIRKSRSTVPFIVGGVFLFLIAGAAIIILLGGNKLLNISSDSGRIKVNQNLTINADGKTITDANGISVTIPTNALEGTSAILSTEDVAKALKEEMWEAYKSLSPAYSLSASGAADGSDPGVLTFPAESSDLRLVTIIDGVYVSELNIPPENGVITIEADIHPSELGELAGTDSMWKKGSIQYMLVRPFEKLEGNHPDSVDKLAAPSRQETPYNCISLSYIRCWQNGNGSVQLMMDKTISLTPNESSKVINYIQSTMDKYETEGFEGAIYTASNPVQVVVIKDSGLPYYQVSNGVIYLPNDIAKKLAAGESDDFLIHELAHWIQDENYYMTSAYLSNSDTWWIETSADNMAMLIDKDYIVRNLHAYAKLDVDGKTSVLQSSPYTWPIKEYYSQAQLVKVNLCESSSCAVNKNTFVSAINNGTYPFADETAQSKLHNNLSDYAKYLLGVAPEKANSGISLAGVATGEEYGDSVIIKQTHDSVFNLEQFTGAERMTLVQGDLPGMLIDAPIQKDGVYVLRVEIAPGNYAPQWPAMLKVESGVEIYYRLNNGELLHHDGKSELFIQPLMQGTTGQEITKVRLVAIGQQGGEVFRAHLSIVDLSGMWVVNMPDQSAWLNNIMCESGDDKEFIAKFSVPMTAMRLMFGDFSTDPASHLFTWTGNPDRVTAMLSGFGESSSSNESGSTFSAAATIDKAQIHLEATAFEPEDTTFEVRPEAYSTQFISIPGTFQLKADFTNLTYFGIEDSSVAAGLPNIKAWELTGDNIRFIFDCELLIQRVNSSAQLEEVEKRNHCTGTVEVPASILIYQMKK